MGLAKIMGQVGLDGSGFSIGAKQVESEAQRLATSISHSLKDELAGVLGVAFLEESVRRTIEFGAQISDLAKRAGVTAEAFQKMSFAFGGNDKISGFLDKMETARAAALQGGKNDPAALAFGKLGVSQSDLKSDTGEVIMSKIGKAIQAGNIQDLIAPLRAVGGRSAGEMVAGFKQGIEERAKVAVEAGAIMSNADVARMKQIDREFEMLTTSFKVDMVPIVETVITSIEDLISGFKVLAAYLGGFFNGHERTKALEETKSITEADLKQKRAAYDSAMKPGSGVSNADKNILYQLEEEARKKALDARNAVDANDKAILKAGFFGQGTAAAQIEQEKQDALKADREAAVRNAASGSPDPHKPVVPLSNTKTGSEETTFQKMSLHVDNLQRMGGFVGAGGGGDMIVTIARRQLTVTEHLAGGVEKIVTYVQGVKQSEKITGPLIEGN